MLSLRLLLPVSLTLPQNKAPIQVPLPQDTILYEPRPVEQQEIETRPAPLPQIDEQPEPSCPTVSLFQALFGLWLLGAVSVALWTILSHLRFLSYLRRWGRKVTDEETIRCFHGLADLLRLSHRPRLVCSPGLKAPMLAGLVRPALLLPEEPLSAQELRFALLHELCHYKRRDIWLKTLALLVRCLHWFNPAVWYMGRLLERDTELACDEAALAQLPPEEHAAYGATILNAVERLKEG